MRAQFLIGLLLMSSGSRMAAAAPLNAANYDRTHGCGGGGLTPLYYNPKLDAAARRVANGLSLQSALEGSGYIATQSAMLHLSGVANDAEIQRVLARSYCATLRDPKLKDFGAERRGRDVWMVLAAPAPLPPRDAAQVRQEILDVVNAARASGRRCGGKAFAPVGPLSLDAALTQAALTHSNDMAEHNLFDHIGRDGSSPAQRVERAGYGTHRIVGENIAAGAMSAKEVAEGWLASPAHCENIMDGRFTQIGIAYAENLKSASAVFWTQDFAAHR